MPPMERHSPELKELRGRITGSRAGAAVWETMHPLRRGRAFRLVASYLQQAGAGKPTGPGCDVGHMPGAAQHGRNAAVGHAGRSSPAGNVAGPWAETRDRHRE